MSLEKSFWPKRVAQRLFEVVGDNNELYDWLCKVVPRLMVGDGDLGAIIWLLQEMRLPKIERGVIKIACNEAKTQKRKFVDRVYSRLRFEKFDLEYSVFVTTNNFVSKTNVLEDRMHEANRQRQLVRFAAVLWRIRELAAVSQNESKTEDSARGRS